MPKPIGAAAFLRLSAKRHERLVVIGDGGNVAGQREDDVKVLRVEELGATILQPLRASKRLAAGNACRGSC